MTAVYKGAAVGVCCAIAVDVGTACGVIVGAVGVVGTAAACVPVSPVSYTHLTLPTTPYV